MQGKQDQKGMGRLLCAAATLCFSLGGICVIGAKGLSPLALSGVRCAVAAAFTGLCCKLRGRKLRFNLSVATGALAVCLTGFCYVAATQLSGAATAIILQYTSPAVSVVWLWCFKKERPGKTKLASVGLVFLGTVCCCAAGAAMGSVWGIAAGLMCGVLFSVVFLSGTEPGADPISAAFFGQLLSAAVGLPFLMGDVVSLPALGWAGLMGLVQTGAAYLLLSAGLSRTDALSANLICAAEPILNAFWAALLAGQMPGAGTIFGGGLVLSGVVLSNTGKGFTKSSQKGMINKNKGNASKRF